MLIYNNQNIIQIYRPQYTLQNIPPIITIYHINHIYDTKYLIDIEQKYQLFIELNQQILLLSDTIEDYLDIRDALLLRIYKLRIIGKKHL